MEDLPALLKLLVTKIKDASDSLESALGAVDHALRYTMFVEFAVLGA